MSLEVIPHRYPKNANSRNTRLFPLAVFERTDFTMDEGHDTAKQMRNIISKNRASNQWNSNKIPFFHPITIGHVVIGLSSKSWSTRRDDARPATKGRSEERLPLPRLFAKKDGGESWQAFFPRQGAWRIS